MAKKDEPAPVTITAPSKPGVSWPTVGISAAVSTITAIFDGFIAFANTANQIENQFNSTVSTLTATQAQNCTLYESWVIDRIHDGFTDQAIASLAVVNRNNQLSLQTVTTSPTPTPTVTSSLSPLDSSMAALFPPEKVFFSPCGFSSLEQLTAFIGSMRSGLNRVPQPTS